MGIVPGLHAGVVRHYVFEGGGGAGALLDRVTGAPISFLVQGAGTNRQSLVWADGREAGTKVPRVDAGALAAEPFSVGTNGFTIAMWFRNNGAGTMRGNAGSENGTLFSMGSGYWDGLRITTHCGSDLVGFEIGQAKPSHAVSVSTGPVVEGPWQHVAATWDGREMRIYINGLPSASKPHAQPFVQPPHGSKMKIGYADHGVGSVVLDVAEVAVHDRALGGADVLRSAYGKQIEDDAAVILSRAGEALMGGDAMAAAAGFEDAVRRPGPARIVALRGLAKALSVQRRPEEAATALVRLLREPGVSPDEASIARMELAGKAKSGAGALIPIDVLAGLPEMPGLKKADRAALLRQLMVRQCEAGDFPAAGRTCEGLIGALAGDQPGLLDAAMAKGHIKMGAGDWAGARGAYLAVADDEGAPVAFRAIAMMQVGEALERQGQKEPAAAAFARAAALKGVDSHLADEARRRSMITGSASEHGHGGVRSPGWPEAGWRFHVATNGSDSATGTAEAPFASLERARDALRSRRAKEAWPPGGAEIIIGGGEYRVGNTFRLAAQDSGKPGAPVVFRSAKGERATFTGGARLTRLQPVKDTSVLARMSVDVHGRLLFSDLRAEGITDFGKFDPGGYASGGGFSTRPLLELYWNGEPMQVARWPNSGWARAGAMIGEVSKDGRGRPVNRQGRFEFKDDRLKRWLAERELCLYGYWFHDWADSYDRVAKIDAAASVIELAPPLHRYGYRGGARFRAVNALCEIDVPGEYYLDREGGILYFLPPAGPAKGVAEISMMGEPFIELGGVSDVGFEGITWELGRADGLHATGGKGIIFAGCTIRRFGGYGITFDGGEGHGLISCDISHLGRGGVALSGGDRKTLKSGGHFVENCHIHHFSRIHPTYTPAILISGVGGRIRHNLMHDSGSSALRIAGNDHLVEFNEVHHVVTESDDQGGIDMWGDPTFRGNIYRWNYWHDIGTEFAVGQAGIRLDDAISGTLIYGNVFYRAGGGHFGGVQIHGGKDNIVDNNIFVECPAAISFSAWGEKRWIASLEGPDTVMAKALKDIDITKPPFSTAYPDLAKLREGADANRIWRNIVWRCDTFLARGRDNHEMVDNLITSGDPGFVDAVRQDWRLKPDAPVLRRSSFRPIPFHRIGLREDPYRPGRKD